MREIIDKLAQEHTLTKAEWIALIESQSESEYLFEKSRVLQKQNYGNRVYTRGLIEFTNYCKNNCYYCGIRRDNQKASRYRLSKEEILACCSQGYELGFRTFVLQGGEDSYYTDDRIVEIVEAIKNRFSDCAVTLSIGEKSKESYQRYYDAGADRYLLRHETAVEEHYQSLHPKEMSYQHRMQSLNWLKEIGYQVGCGFMVGSPKQTAECLAEDMLFISKLQPDMVGIGPFVPHHETPFAKKRQGTLETTLYMIGLLRLLKPNLLLPATTALGTIHPNGRERGILAGANVVMPNLSPVNVRKKYELYDDKICTNDEAAECRGCLENRMKQIGYELVVDRGDPCK